MLVINPFLSAKLIDDVIIPQNPDPLLPLLFSMLAVQVLRQGMRYVMVILLERSAQHLMFNRGCISSPSCSIRRCGSSIATAPET